MSGILVHEWLSPTGGSENVFETLGSIFPDAERWCLWNESDGRFSGVHETFLARTPLRGRKAAALPLMPLAWRTLPSRDADWVLTSSHAFAHHARFRGPAGDIPKFVYAHTPARYVWDPDSDSRGQALLPRMTSVVLKPIDRRRASEPVSIAANSAFVAERILRAWHREATVVHPPVDTVSFSTDPSLTDAEQATLDGLPEGFVLGASRLVEYKRLDAAIDVGVAADLPVVIAGSGPDAGRLRAYAAASGANVVFVAAPSRELLKALYRRARVFVFAPVEDFGIMPVEAMASGTPVIVNAIGGAAESVVDAVTGVHVADWTRAELAAAVTTAGGLDGEDCVARAQAFSIDAFEGRVRHWLAAAGAGRAA